MNSEEIRVRRELEKDIERELEEEIKDQICRLALRLHQLYYYQQQKEKKMMKKNDPEVSIINMIRTEDATRIEIKEIKKKNNINEEKLSEIGQRRRQWPRRRLVDYYDHQKKQQGRVINVGPPKSKTKFNWANSLRSADNEGSGCGFRTRKNIASSLGKQHYMVNKADKIMKMELGWRD